MTPPPAHVRAELLEQFRRANEHFHQCKEEWEWVLKAPLYRHEERVDAARQKLQEAEREVEEVEERIRNIMFPKSPPAPETSAANRIAPAGS